MKQEPKKLDMEAAFRGVAQPPDVSAFENGRRSLKPLFHIYRPAKSSHLGYLVLALFSLVTAGIAFVAVFELTGRSPLALYGAITAAAVAGGLTAPLRYERFVVRILSPVLLRRNSGLPESELPPPPDEVPEIRADLQRETLRNRVIMRVAIFGYVLCLWLLSVPDSHRLQELHTPARIIVIAAPVLLFLKIWLALGPLSKNS